MFTAYSVFVVSTAKTNLMTTVKPTSDSSAEFGALAALAQREHSAGRLAEAAAAYRRVLAARPDLAEAYNNLGNVLQLQGNLNEAAAHYERAVALKPDLFATHVNLGNLLREQGKLDQAKISLSRGLAINPHFPEAHNGLGNVLKDQGKFNEAAAEYEQAIALRRDYAEAYYNLGNVHKDQAKLDEAAAQYQRAIALKPDLFQAHNNLGNVLAEQRKLDQAMASFTRAVTINPNFPDAHNGLGNTLRDQGMLDEAAAHYEHAMALKPSFAEAYGNLGSVLLDQGKFELAVARFEQAIALRPDLAEVHCNLGNALKAQGKFDLAAVQYQHATALRPDHAESHYNRADSENVSHGRCRSCGAGITRRGSQPAARTQDGLYPLRAGKALEDVGNYRRAFEHWQQGNALKRREINYDEAGYQRTCQLIADAFDCKLFDRFSAGGDPSSAPIFVLGMPCSGSTLVEQILASHPLIHAAGELKNLDRIVKAVADPAGRPVPFPAWLSAIDADGLRRLAQAYLASLPTPAGGETRIVDKATTNFLRVGLIRLILPNARIIHTVRDPADTCVSCFTRLFAYGQPFSYDLAELGRYYRGYRKLMDHWRSVLPSDAILDVAYEDVVEDLEQQARRLIAYCSLPWDDHCLSFHQTSRPIATASNVQVRQPLYHSSVARWRRYEAYLQPLLTELEACRQPRVPVSLPSPGF